MKKVSCLSWGLFLRHQKLRWVKDLWIYIKRVFFTLKHGYPPQARWETFAWFIDAMKEILEWCRDNREGSPVIMTGDEDKNHEEWTKILAQMIELLDKMDEDNPIYNDLKLDETWTAVESAKDEFFTLFSKYFYNLWD